MNPLECVLLFYQNLHCNSSIKNEPFYEHVRAVYVRIQLLNTFFCTHPSRYFYRHVRDARAYLLVTNKKLKTTTS